MHVQGKYYVFCFFFFCHDAFTYACSLSLALDCEQSKPLKCILTNTVNVSSNFYLTSFKVLSIRERSLLGTPLLSN